MDHHPVTEKTPQQQNIADNMANERTMLAWVRTGIGIIAFGFAVVKFSLFVRQISLAVGKKAPPSHGYSAEIGIALVGLGILSILFAYVQYHQTGRQIKSGHYQHSPLLMQLLVGLISVIGIGLLVYLVMTT